MKYDKRTAFTTFRPSLAKLLVLTTIGWLVACFGLKSPLRQYFSLYRADPQGEGQRREKCQMRENCPNKPPPAPTASAVGPCPTFIQISRTPLHWQFTQHHRTARPPLLFTDVTSR